MKKVLGYFLLSLPFLGMGAACLVNVGLKDFLIIVGVIAAWLSVTLGGIYLIAD